tara:strand:+ start:397 stop:804 length:408 start_codon:yes stop_codon:yes gene_type:complete
MSESNFWKTVKRNLPSDCHATRIENRHGGGIPDVHIVLNGFSFWIELKVCKGNKVNLSLEQNAWNSAYCRKGGISFILAKHHSEGSLYLFEGNRCSELLDNGLRTMNLYFGKDYKELFSVIRDFGSEKIGSGREK